MKIIFTDHAKKRLNQRAISIKDVRAALKSPTVRKPSYKPTEIIQKITNKGTLEIVFKEVDRNYIIITLYYL